ncbi:MAG: M20/M25/M40 family metallo-hydrolase [Proteobacteria bacterium]|nr:M20/M25/M40 family metallo-hydrolase [Pseudomonadota bacterium]
MTLIRRVLAVSAALALVSSTALAAAPAAPAASAATPRSPAASDALAREILAELVGLDTTHAVGSAKATAALAARFHAAGFPDGDVYVGGPKPDKMNIVVRLHGRGRGEPVLFNAHLDVVEAVRDTWSVEPFRLTEKDGYFYGRGTQDVKEEVALLSANLLRLKREGYVPDRDLILFFNVDEEAGGDANGVEWMLANHRPLIEAGLVINQDAGKVHAQGGRILWNSLQTSEKVYATYTLATTGSGGHSSLPTRDNAIGRLARALARLDAYQFPVRLGPTTRRYLEASRAYVPAAEAAAIDAILKDPADRAAAERLRDSPMLNAQLHSTCPATVVAGGQSESALPMRAQATIQCRLLPDEKPEEVLATFARVIDDAGVQVSVDWPPLGSPEAVLDPAVVGTIERVTTSMWPGVPVVPAMSSGASDNVYFRRAGLKTYGVSGTAIEEGDSRAHGRDERVGVTAFYESLEFSYRLMKALAAAR